MDKCLACKFAVFAGLNLVVTELNSRPKDPDYVAPDSELDMVLREIFTVDPDTGAPKGDITYFMSGNGNPMVKQWIQQNLFSSMRSSGGYDPKTTDDDLIVEMSRQDGETVSAYSSRLLGLYDAAKNEEIRLRESLNYKED